MATPFFSSPVLIMRMGSWACRPAGRAWRDARPAGSGWWIEPDRSRRPIPADAARGADSAPTTMTSRGNGSGARPGRPPHRAGRGPRSGRPSRPRGRRPARPRRPSGSAAASSAARSPERWAPRGSRGRCRGPCRGRSASPWPAASITSRATASIDRPLGRSASPARRDGRLERGDRRRLGRGTSS